MSNDGGQAFPIADAYDADGRLIAYGNAGMTLHDWFAGQALAGAIANSDVLAAAQETAEKDGKKSKNGLALFCIQIADAMLAERERRK
jgi:hypothetical protein